ncbi:MAG: penicillin acylase family protein, partial [Fibrella sp.]|nr:penicillin acylase family protein [Armatimonadota bacterium]
MKPPTLITPVSAGKRRLGLHVQEGSDKDYGKAFALARNVGVGVVPLSLDWSGVETASGEFTSPFPRIANSFYPAQKMPLLLILRPINTVKREVPADLAKTAWDDTRMRTRFRTFLDSVLGEMPDVTLAGLVIGNEVSDVLSAESNGWRTYRTFLADMREYVHAKRPGIPVGVTISHSGLTDKKIRRESQALNAVCDTVFVTYYPLHPDFSVRSPDAPLADFESILRLYPSKSVHFVEAGYPSSPDCKSDEMRQARFVESVFAAWDKHTAQVPMVSFSWQTDRSAQEVAELMRYYAVPGKGFRGFLASLGLRTWEGQLKPGWETLAREAKARGGLNHPEKPQGGGASTAGGFYRWVKPPTFDDFRAPCDNAFMKSGHTATIIRDAYGVPHVFADTEPGALYGFGYAQAQDRLAAMLGHYLASRGEAASVLGAGYLERDIAIRAFRLPETAAKRYGELSPELRAGIESFVEGINRFQSDHPEKCPAWAFAVSPTDVASLGLMYNLYFATDHFERSPATFGSNGFAVAGQRTAFGNAIVSIDPHLSIDGPLRWYEGHVCGGALNMYGVAFVGTPYMAMGTNGSIAWANTVNAPDLSDYYEVRLQQDAGKPPVYEYDGETRPCDVRTYSFSVRHGNGDIRTVNQTVVSTHHGPILREENGKRYAIRKAGIGDVHVLTQVREQCLAQNV